MEKSKLNEMLLEHFPELKVEFDNQTSWQEGMDTGCTVTYADVFAPFAAEVLLSKNAEKTQRIFQFIECLASLHDEYADQVVMLSIFDPLLFLCEDFTIDCALYPHAADLFQRGKE